MKDGIDDKQYRDDSEDFFLTACSLARAHEREWQVGDCSVTTGATNTISAMTQASNVAIAEFVANVSKMVIPSMQPEQAEQPPQEIINDDLNVKIEMNTDKEKLITKSERKKIAPATLLSGWITCQVKGSRPPARKPESCPMQTSSMN